MTDRTSAAGTGVTEQPPGAANGRRPWFAEDGALVITALDSDAGSGLTHAEATGRLAKDGPNRIVSEKPPSVLMIALQQLRDPMNIMLVAVVVVSLAIGEVSTAIIVGLLIALNVVLGARQELSARASVDALEKMQVPQAKVIRDGTLELVPAVDVVPGDVVHVEAGDLVPADGRILQSATLEVQEAALTGESAPVPKSPGVLASDEVALGDRVEHGVPEHVGDPRHRGDRRDGHGHEHRTRPDRDDADVGQAGPLAVAEGTRVADEGARPDRLDRGGLHRGGRVGARHGAERDPAAGHGDGHLGDPDGHAGLRLGAALVRRASPGRREGRREEPDRRGDAGRHKWIRRRRTTQPTIDARQAVAPAHARNERIGVAVK
jgi:hypothetical protein